MLTTHKNYSKNNKKIKAGNGGIIRNKYKGRINKALLIDVNRSIITVCKYSECNCQGLNSEHLGTEGKFSWDALG